MQVLAVEMVAHRKYAGLAAFYRGNQSGLLAFPSSFHGFAFRSSAHRTALGWPVPHEPVGSSTSHHCDLKWSGQVSTVEGWLAVLSIENPACTAPEVNYSRQKV